MRMEKALAVVALFAWSIGFGCQVTAEGKSAAENKAVPASAPAGDPACPALKVAAATTKHPVEDSNGPTVLLSYGKGTHDQNPMRSFMYFIPLISPVPVDRNASAENRQQVAILSYERKVTSKSFSVACEFEMAGGGFSRYTFDPAGMIAKRVAESKKAKGECLSNVLDYINFEGEGFGKIQIRGTINDAVETVTEVDLDFNERGRRSPVTIGLYELKSKNRQYRYENRSSEIVARVNTLSFKKSETPRMGITVASITKKAGGNGPLAQLKAAIANLFIKPVKIDPLGNETLLNFGYALLEQKPSFTFPKADNMKEAGVLAADPKKE